jgi:hypothetical protein
MEMLNCCSVANSLKSLQQKQFHRNAVDNRQFPQKEKYLFINNFMNFVLFNDVSHFPQGSTASALAHEFFVGF